MGSRRRVSCGQELAHVPELQDIITSREVDLYDGFMFACSFGALGNMRGVIAPGPLRNST